jgi:hypothetical protein
LPNGLIVERRLLKVERVIGETTVRRTVETDIVLPFKIIKIFDVIANVMDVQTEVGVGGVDITGVIHKQLFVVDRGDVVRHLDEDVPFQVFVPVAGAAPGMNVQVDIRVISVDTSLIDPLTVRQMIILEIFVKVTVTEQIEVVVDVRDTDIIVKKELLKVDSVVGEDLIMQTFTPTVTLPITAKKIFRILPTVRDVTAEVRFDTVILRGVIHKQVFFVDEGDLVRHATEDIPFTRTVDIPGARPGMHVQFNVKVIVQEFELIDPPSRLLRQVLVIEAFVKVTETLQLEVVVDVQGKFIVVTKKLLKVEAVVVDVLQQETLRAVVTLPVQAIKVFEIVGRIVNLQAEARFDQVVVRGILHKQIFFVDPGNLVRHAREDIPFTFVKMAPGARPGMNVQVSARIVGDIRHRIVDTQGLRLEQTAVIEIFVKVTRTVQLEVVTDVRRVIPPLDPPPKSTSEEES